MPLLYHKMIKTLLCFSWLSSQPPVLNSFRVWQISWGENWPSVLGLIFCSFFLPDSFSPSPWNFLKLSWLLYPLVALLWTSHLFQSSVTFPLPRIGKCFKEKSGCEKYFHIYLWSSQFSSFCSLKSDLFRGFTMPSNRFLKIGSFSWSLWEQWSR